jgi:eukaryotic-like serine/threonine-protein kinase
MGVVYRGRDEGLDRDVAVKVIRGESLDDESQAQFLKEARAAARLQHPGIVTVFELGEEGGAPFMAMELLDGQDLQHAMRQGRLSDPARALAVIEQVLAALGHAHARGIVHRDLKPSNVFLHAGTHVKILDFGVARLGEGLTVTGRVVGTPHYMSPEQIRADPVDGRSDLFSTALMFYEMVTGAKAYRPGSAVTIMYQIVHEDPDLSRLPPTPLGAALLAVLRRALARDRNERYPDGAALATALAAAVRSHPYGPPTSEPVLEVATVVSLPAPDLALDARRPLVEEADLPLAAEPPERRAPAAIHPPAAIPPRAASRRTTAAAALVVLLAAAAGATWWWQSRQRMASPTPIESPTTTLAAVPSTTTSEIPVPSPTPSLAPLPTVEPVVDEVPPDTTAPSVPPPAPTPRAISTTRPSRPASAAPMDAQSRLDRAEQLFQAGRLRAALAEVRAVLREQPDNAEAKYLADDIELDLAVEDHLTKARAALARGDRDTARREAEAGLRVKPNESRLTALLRQLGPS